MYVPVEHRSPFTPHYWATHIRKQREQLQDEALMSRTTSRQRQLPVLTDLHCVHLIGLAGSSGYAAAKSTHLHQAPCVYTIRCYTCKCLLSVEDDHGRLPRSSTVQRHQLMGWLDRISRPNTSCGISNWRASKTGTKACRLRQASRVTVETTSARLQDG